MRFLLTVRKCYRPVPYHNWNHAFSVAHASYVIMSQSTDVFTESEVRNSTPPCQPDIDHFLNFPANWPVCVMSLS